MSAAAPEPRDPALEAAIRARPDDPSAYLVLGDWLEQRGHPRGKLIAIQAAIAADRERGAPPRPELERAQAALIEALSRALGEAGEAGDPERRCEWRFGFWESVVASADEDLAALLASPSARFVRRVGLRSTRELGDASRASLGEGPHALDEGTVTGLARMLRADRDRTAWLAALPLLRERGLGGVELWIDEHTVDAADGEALASIRGLTTLSLTSHHLVPDSVSREAILALGPLAPSIERLGLLRCSNADDEACEMIAGFSRLTTLALDSTRAVTPRGLAALARLPGLADLGLARNYELEDPAVEALARFPALARLDASQTSISPSGLVRLAEVLPTLRELVVDGWPYERPLDDRGCEVLGAGRPPIVSLRVAGDRISLAGLARLAALPLRRLNVRGTACVDDAAAEVLAGFTSLERLVLLDTRISGAAIVGLAAALPRLCELVVEPRRLPPEAALAVKVSPY